MIDEPARPDGLYEIGFKLAGYWRLENGALTASPINDPVVRELWKLPNVLYAFASESSLYYIGKTTRTLRSRMYEYERGDPNLRTNKKCHDNIAALLTKTPGSTVGILIFSPYDTHLYWGNFRINVAAGLEDSLILELTPPWNGSNRGPIQTESSATEEALAPADDASIAPYAVTSASAATPVTFKIDLSGEVYWNSGYINPPAEYHGLIGQPGEPITLHLEGISQPLARKITRAIQGKDYPRIYGGKELAKWFQCHFHRSDFVTVEIRSPHELRFLKKKSGSPTAKPMVDSPP